MSKTAWLSGCAALGLLIVGLTSPAHAFTRGKPVHGIAYYGEPKYGPDFTHFDYVNPDAPKGGTITLTNANDHTFDTFNSFTLKGNPARGVGLLHETLMIGGDDEPFTNYCMLCETVEIAADNSWVEFKLRPQARFHDGSPVAAEDVAFSFKTLLEKGAPMYKFYWADVDKVEVRDPSTVRFLFKTKDNRELPGIVGQLPVFSKAFWASKDFAATTLDALVGTGPYLIDTFEVGRFITYKRNPNYWAKDLPVVRGMFNFDHVRYEYFRDDTVQFEAFKTGAFDIKNERTAARWATGYDFPAFQDGRVKKLEVIAGTPMDAQGFIWNVRRPQFADRRVRQALNLAFDFESLNRTLFYGQYTRVRSFWQRSELEAKGLPTPAELALLEPLRDKVPPEVFTQEFAQPTTDGQGNPRDNLLKARELLEQAGWENKNGQLVKKGSGEPFVFEVLLIQASLDRILLPWFQNLERLGIKASMRVIDTSQFTNRVNDYDFDMIISAVRNSLSPGNEQLEFWGSEAAGRPGSRNYSGVKDPAVDSLVATIINAADRESLVTAAHALDRVLTWNFYFTLHYGSLAERYAHWTKLSHPEKFPLHGLAAPGEGVITTWWASPVAAATSAPVTAEPQDDGNTWMIPLLVIGGLIVVGFIVLRRRRG
jgi:microcin C transport system substrate-binding protein